MKRHNTSGNIITVFLYDARSLSKHRGDTVSDDRILINDIIGFTGTQTIRFYLKINGNIDLFSKLILMILKINF